MSCDDGGGESAPLSGMLVARAFALAAGGHRGLAVLRVARGGDDELIGTRFPRQW